MKPATRGWAALALALAGLLVVIDSAPAQPGFRGGRPGTFTGRPPGMPGSNIGGMPRPGGVIGGPGIGGPGMVGPGIGGTVTVWSCPNCKREVGRGNLPPAMVTCCGQTYVNGKSLGFGPPPVAPPTAPPVVPPVTPAQPAPAPFVPPAAPAEANPPPPAAPPVFNNPVVAGVPASADASQAISSGSGKLIALGVGIVLVGLLMLGGVVFLVVQSQRSGAPAPRRRRVRRRDY